VAFSINCTHLGCPVRWLPDANLFMCLSRRSVLRGR
jgi:menaquinol-cytochrome c reductase iron-sulfur subunit